MNTQLLFTHALSPLHAGTGRGEGVIDLPIAREKGTGLPFLPGSSVKGTLRDSCADEVVKKRIFGPDTAGAEEHAGAAQFSDQRLLLLPVRSVAGTFAWVTSPYVLWRFVRDLDGAGITGLREIAEPSGDNCFVSDQQCKITTEINRVTKVVLEDLDLTASGNAAGNASARQWAEWIGQRVFPGADNYWQRFLKERICIVPDNVLGFLVDTATEITARIKLMENAKTVQKGGLRYEESLPTETILCGLVVATPVKDVTLQNIQTEIFTPLTTLIQRPLQFGGKATVGRGVCQLRMTGGN